MKKTVIMVVVAALVATSAANAQITTVQALNIGPGVLQSTSTNIFTKLGMSSYSIWHGNSMTDVTGMYLGRYNANNPSLVGVGFYFSNYGLTIGKSSNATFDFVLDVVGRIRADAFILYTSDKRYKKDIKPLAESFDKLSKLNSVRYKRSSEGLRNKLEDLKNNQDKYKVEEETFKSWILDLEERIELNEKDTLTHFGFIAQELRELYPELVFEDDEGYLNVSYSGMIPVLVDVIKELYQKIEKLESKGFEKINTTQVISPAKLYQNNPNPFNENTEIKFYVPENSSSAMICIYDLTGSQIMKFDLHERGYSSLTVRGRELKAGMYIYSLIVDGKEIDTKRMILTE